MKSIRAYIALGSNLGDSRRHLDNATTAIAALPDTRLVKRAALYRTAPQDVTRRQPPFINTVVAIDTALSPAALFTALRRIERQHRRTRPHKNAPRTLDLDLLLYGTRISHSKRLTLPHPRLHLRPFVLVPLTEIAPDLIVPGQMRATTLLRRCTPAQLWKIS